MILVAGSANLDFVVRAAHIPGPGETVLGHGFETFAGGKGANQACACARAGGVPTRFLGAMGSDAFANPIEVSLRQAGVVLDVVRAPHDKTGTAFICVSDDAENAITVAPGANQYLQPHHMPDFSGISHLLMQLEVPLPTVAAFALQAHAQGVCVVLNAAPMQVLPDTLLDCIDVLIVNEGELRALAGPQGSLAQCLERIRVPAVIVTLGSRGCLACERSRLYVQPAFAITAVDTTGAGDTFCGTLVAALSQGFPLPHALRHASAAGALACTRHGAQTSVPEAWEVQALAAQGATADAVLALQAYCGIEP